MVFITDHAPTEFMENKAITAVALVLTLLLAGCLNVDPDVDVPDVVLPTIGPASPPNRGEPSTLRLRRLRRPRSLPQASIEEQYRVELLQAVAEQYYYNDFMWAEDAEMAMDDGRGRQQYIGSTTHDTNPCGGEDFSGTNNQEAGVDEADFVKTDGYHIYYLKGRTCTSLASQNSAPLRQRQP